jgi:hypothetical protein
MSDKKRLLDELDGKLKLAINEPASIEKVISTYYAFEKNSDYDKRIRVELINLFYSKKNNTSYFFQPPKDNKMKTIGFNQMVHTIVRRLWDEEEFAMIAKNPSEIVFLEADKEYKEAKVSLEDAQKYVYSLKILPFITSDSKFFTLSDQNKLKKSLEWLKLDKFNTIPKLLDRLKLVGSYVQTVYFAGTNLIDIAQKSLEKKPIETEEEISKREEEKEDLTLEKKADILAKIITRQKEVTEGYFLFTESVLRRNLVSNRQDLLKKDTELKVYVEFVQQARSHNLRISNEAFIKCVERIVREFREATVPAAKVKGGEEPPIKAPPTTTQTVSPTTAESTAPLIPSKTHTTEPTTTVPNHPPVFHIDYIHIVDYLLHEFRILFKHLNDGDNLQSEIDHLTEKLHHENHSIQKKHVTMIYLLLKEAKKTPGIFDEGSLKLVQTISTKLDIPEKDCKLVYLLLQSENDKTLSEKPLSEFVEDCIAQDDKGILTETHIKILRTLFANIPITVKANQFYTIKEVLKSKIPDENKKKVVDSLTNLIHLRVRELRANYVVKMSRS